MIYLFNHTECHSEQFLYFFHFFFHQFSVKFFFILWYFLLSSDVSPSQINTSGLQSFSLFYDIFCYCRTYHFHKEILPVYKVFLYSIFLLSSDISLSQSNTSGIQIWKNILHYVGRLRVENEIHFGKYHCTNGKQGRG